MRAPQLCLLPCIARGGGVGSVLNVWERVEKGVGIARAGRKPGTALFFWGVMCGGVNAKYVLDWVPARSIPCPRRCLLGALAAGTATPSAWCPLSLPSQLYPPHSLTQRKKSCNFILQSTPSHCDHGRSLPLYALRGLQRLDLGLAHGEHGAEVALLFVELPLWALDAHLPQPPTRTHRHKRERA